MQDVFNVFCSCSFWVSLWSLRVQPTLLEATGAVAVAVVIVLLVVLVNFVVLALLVVTEHIIFSCGYRLVLIFLLLLSLLLLLLLLLLMPLLWPCLFLLITFY